MENLENCLYKVNELSVISSSILATPHVELKTSTSNGLDEELSHETSDSNEDDYLDKSEETVLKLILNDSTLVQGSFKSVKLTAFLNKAWSILSESDSSSNYRPYKKYFQVYLEKFLFHAKEDNEAVISDEKSSLLNKHNLDFIGNLNLNRASFAKLVVYVFKSYSSYLENEAKIKLSLDDEQFNKFAFFVKILLTNQNKLFENDIQTYDELNSLSETHVVSLVAWSKMLKLLLLYISKLDYNQAMAQSSESNEITTFLQEKKEALAEFIMKSFRYNSLLFKLVFRNTCFSLDDTLKLPKYLKKFAANNQILLNIFELCVSAANVFDGVNSRLEKDKNPRDLVTLANNVEGLLASYSFTISQKDQAILSKLYKLDPSLNVLMFKLNENTNSKATIDALSKQAKIVDFIALKLEEHKVLSTIQNYPISRKLSDLTQEQGDANIESNETVKQVFIYVLQQIGPSRPISTSIKSKFETL